MKINFIKNKIKKDFHFGELFFGFSAALIFRILGIFFSYIFILFISRIYGARGVGIFALSYTFLIIFSTFSKMGCDMTFLKLTAENKVFERLLLLKKISKKILFIITGASFIVSIVGFFTSEVIADIVLKKHYMSIPLKIVSVIIYPMTILSVFAESIRGFKKIKEYMTLRFVFLNIIALVFLVTFYLLDKYKIFTLPIYQKNFLPIISYGFSIVFTSILVILIWKRLFKRLKKDSIIGNLELSFKTIFTLSIPMFFSSILTLIIDWSDIIMLGIYRSASDVGYYNVAIRVGRLIAIILTAINTIAAPKFAEFWGKRDINGLIKVARQSTKLIFWITLPIFIFLFLFPELILSIFGKEFKIASLSLIILLTGFFFSAVCGSVGMILQMTGHQVYHQNIIFIGAIINILLNYFLIPKYGINGAAIASTVTIIYNNLCFSIKVRNITGKYIFYPAFYKE